MTEHAKINGWTFEETVKTAENLMEAEQNIFKWDVLRHIRDFAENYKHELEQYTSIGTPEECRAAVEKQKEIRNKAIDDFVDKADDLLGASDDDIYCKESIKEIAEQLKAGDVD